MTLFNKDHVEQMLRNQVQASVMIALKRIADEACGKLQEEIMGQADTLALRMVKEYDIEIGRDRILITVKKL